MSNPSFTEYFVALGPLLLGLIAARGLRFNLKGFLGVFILLAAASVASAYLYLDIALFPVVLSLALGPLALVVATGALGTKLSPRNYAAILMAAGLFPWYAGMGVSLVYVFLGLIILAFHAGLRASRAFRSLGLKRMKFEQIKKRTTSEVYEELVAKSRIYFALPLLAGALVTLLVA